MSAKAVGQLIQDLRLSKDLTQQELCEKAHVSYSTLSKIEHGAISSPSISTVQKLCSALGVTVTQLLEGGDASSARPKDSVRMPTAKEFLQQFAHDLLGGVNGAGERINGLLWGQHVEVDDKELQVFVNGWAKHLALREEKIRRQSPSNASETINESRRRMGLPPVEPAPQPAVKTPFRGL